MSMSMSVSSGSTRPSVRVSVACFVAIAFTLGTLGAQGEARERKDDKEKRERAARLLTRSIYLPVEFKLCEHLHDAVLYQGDQALSVLPARRIFQFTYYPTLGRIEPVRTDIRVEGERGDGSDFLGRLAVTAWGVFTANHKVKLDLDSQLQKMRYKLDVRYDTLVIRIACSDACEKNLAAAAATVADGATDPEKQ
jgi:hypothetical protein